jgi:hypothetical protein
LDVINLLGLDIAKDSLSKGRIHYNSLFMQLNTVSLYYKEIITAPIEDREQSNQEPVNAPPRGAAAGPVSTQSLVLPTVREANQSAEFQKSGAVERCERRGIAADDVAVCQPQNGHIQGMFLSSSLVASF